MAGYCRSVAKTDSDKDKRYVQAAMDATGLSLSGLAELAGVSSSTLTRRMNNPDYKYALSYSTLNSIEAASGVPLFKELHPTAVQEGEQPPPGAAMVPVYDVVASAGPGTFAESDYETSPISLAFPSDYLRKLTSSGPRHLSIIGVKGESMEPTLLDDDVVLLDTSKTSLSYDGLFVLRFDDALHIKRIGRSPKSGHVMVLSDNKDLYPPVEAPGKDLTVIGKVLWYGRKV